VMLLLERRGKAFAHVRKQMPYAPLTLSLYILYLTYPSVLQTAFLAFDCEIFEDAKGSHHLLREDYRIDCDSDEYESIRFYAWAAIAVFAFGVPFGTLALLLKCREALMHDRSTPLTRATRFLHKEYLPGFFWFEALELLRKGYFVGFTTIVFRPGTISQQIASVLIALVWLFCLTSVLRPLRDASDNFVYFSCSFALTSLLILCLIFQVDWFLEQSEEFVSASMVSRYTIDSSSLTWVTILMIVSVLALVGLVLFVQTLQEWHRDKEAAKWSVPTLEPPYTRWAPKKRYSCFLSHYKLEAASDARYLSDLLRKMLRCPTFLDSSTLTNLTTLFEQGVQKSDVLVVLATRNVLSRPWCLLEILEATRHNVPLLLLEMRGSGFVKEEAHAFVTALETELPKHNEQAYQTLVQYLGTNSLAELKAAVLTLLLKAPVVEWNASARDEQVLAQAQTLCEKMAEISHGQPIAWISPRRSSVISLHESLRGQQAESSRGQRSSTGDANDLSTPKRPGDEQSFRSPLAHKLKKRTFEYKKRSPGAVIICAHAEAAAHAHALQSELSIALQRDVVVGSEDMVMAAFSNDEVEVAVLLLTETVLEDDEAMREAVAAVETGRLLVPVHVVGAGYGFHMASKLAGFLQQEGTDSQKLFIECLCCSIAVDWRPENGKFMVEAAAAEIRIRGNEHRKSKRLAKGEIEKGASWQRVKARVAAGQLKHRPRAQRMRTRAQWKTTTASSGVQLEKLDVHVGRISLSRNSTPPVLMRAPAFYSSPPHLRN